MKKEDLEILLDAKLQIFNAERRDLEEALAKGGDAMKVVSGFVLTCEELVRGDEMTWDELEKEAEKNGLGGKVKKIRSLVHLNNLEYVRGADNKDPMLPVIMKRLGAEFGYVERRDVTSGGKEIQSVVLPMELVPMEVVRKVRGGGDE